MLEHHKLLIVKQLEKLLIVKVNSYVSLVDVDNTDMYGLNLNQMKVKDLNSLMPLLEELSLENTLVQ